MINSAINTTKKLIASKILFLMIVVTIIHVHQQTTTTQSRLTALNTG